MHAAERPTKKRPRALPYPAMILSLLAVICLPAAARAQWTTTGSNISNSNAGNVGVGTGSNAPASRLEVVNPAGGYDSINYFQVTGTTTDNNNYPGFQLKGGSWATEYPQFKLGNAGLAAFIWGGRSPTMGPNRMGLLLYSNLNTYAYASLQKFDGTNTTDLFVVRDSGNVGVGTLTPGYRLHIAGDNTSTGGYPIIKLQNTQAGGHSFWLYAGATGTPGAFGLYDETAAKYRFFFDSSGNLGVGTTSPGNTLSVQGGASITGSLLVDAPGSVGSNRVMLASGTQGSGGTMTLTTLSSSGSGWNTGLYMNNVGNVGVGTTSPVSPLHVQQAAANDIPVARFGDGAGSLLFYPQTLTSYEAMQAGGRSGLILDATGSTASDQLVLGAGGGVGVGKVPAAQYKLDVSGDTNLAGALHTTGAITADGAITGATVNATYQDVAEWVPSTQKLSAGTVVVLDTNKTNHVLASTKPYDTGVAGVVSDNPGVILGQGGGDKVKVATTGRVKVRVDATRAPIHVGDLLVTSEAEGVAMKSVPVDLGGVQIHRPGTIIGKALEPLEKGMGEILVLLSLQ